jgi:hypothetical protein
MKNKPAYQIQFEQLCHLVVHHYQPILSVFEMDFYNHYLTLDENSRRLFIQLLQHSSNRIYLQPLIFDDIQQLEQTALELSHLPFVHLHTAQANDKSPKISYIRLSCQDVYVLYQLLYFGNSTQRLCDASKLKIKEKFTPKLHYHNREILEWHLTIISLQKLLENPALSTIELLNIKDCLPQFQNQTVTPIWLINELQQFKDKLAQRLR